MILLMCYGAACIICVHICFSPGLLPQRRYKAWQKSGRLWRAVTPKALARTSCSARWEGERSCCRLSIHPQHAFLGHVSGAHISFSEVPCHYLTPAYSAGEKITPLVQGTALPHPPGHGLQLPAALGAADEGRAAGGRNGCQSRAALVPTDRSQLGRVISSPGNFSISYLGYFEGKG